MLSEEKMSSRHFDNTFSDLGSGDQIEIDYRLWRKRIKKMIESILRTEHYTPAPREGGIYTGVAGIAYMLWYVASKFPEFAELKEDAR